MDDTFGKRLWLARRDRDLTQQELSQMARVGRTYIAVMERTSRMPGADVAIRLSDSLGVSLDWLLKGVGEPHTMREAVDA